MRAYAINSKGISYGEEVVFTTDFACPVLDDVTVSEVTMEIAKGSSKVIDDGGTDITECGICWNTKIVFLLIQTIT